MILTRTKLGWRLTTDDASIDLTTDQANEIAARITGRPVIQRYGPAPSSPGR